MGDKQSCLRNTSSQSCLDTPKGERSSLQQSHIYDLHREGKNKCEAYLIDLKDNNDDFLNLEESPNRSLFEFLPTTPRDVKGKKSTIDHFDWSVPNRCPRDVTDENFPKPKLLSHGARRERLEELKRLNQQLKSSPRNPSLIAKFQPIRETIMYNELSKPSEGNKGPSLLELEVQALASLGFVKLQPDIAVEQELPDMVMEPDPSQQKILSDVEQLDSRYANPFITKLLEPLKQEPEREDLLELEKVALRSMKVIKISKKSLQDVGAVNDLLELQKVALASMRAAIPQVQPSPPQSQETARPNLLQFQTKMLPREKCLLHPESTVSNPFLSEEMTKIKCSLHPSTTPCISKSPPPPPPDHTAKENIIEVQKMAQSYKRCKLHPNGAPPKPPLSPLPEDKPRHNLLQPSARKCLLHPSASSLQPSLLQEFPKVTKSVIRSVSPSLQKPYLPTPLECNLLELQKVAIASMKDTSATSSSQSSVVAQPAVPSTNLQYVASDRSDLLELQKVALASISDISILSSLQSVAIATSPISHASSPVSDLLELQKVALASMTASAKLSKEAPMTPESQPAVKNSVESEKTDLLELQRMALAKMLAARRQGGEDNLQIKTSMIAEDEVQSSIITPTSSCSSFHLEPANGPLETMLVELTLKDKALQVANKKIIEKEQLLQEYESELRKALKMLESMSVRCTNAKEETAKALSEAKHIYDELSQAWSAVEDVETISKDSAAVFSEGVDHDCYKEAQKTLLEKVKKMEVEERKKWIEDFLVELRMIESARSEVQKNFEQQLQKNENIIAELQHSQGAPSMEHKWEAQRGEDRGIDGSIHEDGYQSHSDQEECDHMFLEQIPMNKIETNPLTSNIEHTSKKLVLELRKIESTRQENQKLFQEQIDRNEQILAQLQEMESCYQEGNQQRELMLSKHKKQWEAEEAQLNSNISELHEALEEVHEALYDKTKEANELHEQTLCLQRSVLEQKQRLRKPLEYHKVYSFHSTKSAMVDFNGDTSDLEADISPHYSSTPEKTDFVGDTLDLESYVCSTCSLIEYICANCSTEPTGSDITLSTKFCLSIKAETVDFAIDTRELENTVYTMDFQGDTHELELINAICTMEFGGDTRELELANAICTTDFGGDTRELELANTICIMDVGGDTQELELANVICTMDFGGDTRELEKVIHTETRVDKSVLVKRDDKENKRLMQEREKWEVERKELIKRLDDFEASLLAKEEKIGNLIEKLIREESTWHGAKYELIKCIEECETRLLAKEEEVIELSTQLEMAKFTLQGFTCTDSSTVVSTSSNISIMHPSNKEGSKIGSHAIMRLGKSDAHELLDLRCEVLSLHECLVIKGEALKTMENELARSYTIINELRTKLARIQESERTLVSRQNNNWLNLNDLDLTNGQSLEQKLKRKATKKPRLLREFDQSITRSNQNQAELLEKLRVQSEQLTALEKERAIMSRKIEDLIVKCKYLEGIEKMYIESQDPLKAEVIMDLEKELERNIEIIKKIQLRCSEFESRALEAENRLKILQSDDNSMIPNGSNAKKKKAWQAEREGILAGLKYFREQTDKKDEELYQLRYELRAQKQKKSQTPRTPPPACKSNLIIECPETLTGSVVEMIVHDTNSCKNSNLQLARLQTPTAAILEFEHRETNHNGYHDHEDVEMSTHQTLQIRELTKQLRDQWKLQCVMEDRLDAMMAYVSGRVKDFEQQSHHILPSVNFCQFHDEARLMKSQLEQQLQVLRGTLSSSFHKLDEAKRQLQVTATMDATGKEILPFVNSSYTTERSVDPAAVATSKKGKVFQPISEKMALEDSAQTLQEKTSKLLHRLTSTRLEWNMNMLAASMAAG